MSDLTSKALARPVAEIVSRLVHERLDAAAAALARCRDATHAEALHDFRVAVRRARTLLRAYRPFVRGLASKRLRRRLRGLAEATNAGRDAEVLLAWLRTTMKRRPLRESAAAGWLTGVLSARRDALRDAMMVRFHQANGFPSVVTDLRQRASRATGREGMPSHFGMAWAAALRAHSAALLAASSPVPGPADHDGIHALRIRAKRLRYVLDPVAPLTCRQEVLDELRHLQDLLGELTDAHVADQQLAGIMETEGAPREALRALARRLGAWRRRAAARLMAHWTPERIAALGRAVDAAAGQLERLTRRRPDAPRTAADGRNAAAARAARPARRRRRERWQG